MMRVQITGLESSLKKLKDNYDKAAQEIDAEMAATSESIVTTAKQILPANFGQLRSSLYSRGGKFNYVVGSNLDYAAYIEFGTGPYAARYVPSLEQEWQKYAATFKKEQPGNSVQHPYFYPSIKSWTIVLLDNIKRIITKYERL